MKRKRPAKPAANLSEADTTTHCVIYARCSPQRNSANKAKTIAAQIDLCREKAEKAGYRVIAVMYDQAASGADEQREGLFSALKALSKGAVLMCWKRDRLARSVFFSEWIRREVLGRGGSIEAVEGDTEETGPEADLIRQILSAFSEYERKLIRSRTQTMMLKHQANGRRMSDITPYGWKRDPTDDAMMVHNDLELIAIERLMYLRASGDGFREIARKLNRENHPCRGAAWSHKNVARLVRRNGAT